LNKIRAIRKLLAQCRISNGIPATQNPNPVWRPPVIKYGMEHNKPKLSPNAPDRIAQNRELV